MVAVLAAMDINPVTMAVLTTLDAAVPGGVALLDEASAERAVSEAQRLSDLSTGIVEADPWRLIALAALALVTIERISMLVFGLIYAVWVIVVAGRGFLSYDDVLGTTFLYAFPVALPWLIVAALVLSRYLAHRVPRRSLIWTLAALLGAVLVDIVLLVIASNAYDLPVDVGIAAKLYGLFLVPEIFAAYLGVRWANRDRGAYLLARVYKHLRAPDQLALIDLASGVAHSE